MSDKRLDVLYQLLGGSAQRTEDDAHSSFVACMGVPRTRVQVGPFWDIDTDGGQKLAERVAAVKPPKTFDADKADANEAATACTSGQIRQHLLKSACYRYQDNLQGVACILVSGNTATS
ncbi:hypothetical protein FOXB_17792 [Fusarium oxysporum f. sp. conglutinans Fo5176]|uniref:Uncharacterized protein n=1 Tax=Fusarium oxysporum (strain Fo5176) TaxID=660025 RepID=F9GGK8_FUSOF|nr:hypothetical protein FOXB_17792 [Fusarium oxysporum f. sp. conglutinans Fo5176]